ncbi:MAG: tRNA (cytidine(34)-2'-O)-methyltransferase [Lawsonella sp.]
MSGANVRILFARPCIPPNTGNAIRTSAVTGCELHLAGPLGFDLEDKHLHRAGLDYHDMAHVFTHQNLDAALAALTGGPDSAAAQAMPENASRAAGRVFAFSARGQRHFGEVNYRPGDVLLFGPEPSGLTDAELSDPRVTEVVRVPMLPSRRSMNLANTAAIAVFEAWRQMGYPGAL